MALLVVGTYDYSSSSIRQHYHRQSSVKMIALLNMLKFDMGIVLDEDAGEEATIEGDIYYCQHDLQTTAAIDGKKLSENEP